MSLRINDLGIPLLDPRREDGCGQATATNDFCPTASATLGVTEALPAELDVLRTELRAALGK